LRSLQTPVGIFRIVCLSDGVISECFCHPVVVQRGTASPLFPPHRAPHEMCWGSAGHTGFET